VGLSGQIILNIEVINHSLIMLIAIPNSKIPNLSLSAYYQQVRQLSEHICQPLEIEDYVVQSMPDASPLKWHLAHTAWFFEAFILVPHLKGYTVFNPKYDYLLNSYYESLGERVPAAQRGTLSRPTVAEVYRY
jgi:hypothetical protein